MKRDSLEEHIIVLKENIEEKDSLIGILRNDKYKLRKDYEKKIDDIRNATPSDNFEWLDTKLGNIRQYYDNK